MTCNLLRKELLLTAHPTFYVFLFMGALVLVPGYPFGIGLFLRLPGPVFYHTVRAGKP